MKIKKIILFLLVGIMFFPLGYSQDSGEVATVDPITEKAKDVEKKTKSDWSFLKILGMAVLGLAVIGYFFKISKDIESVKKDNENKIQDVKDSLDDLIKEEVDKNIAIKSKEYVSKYFSEQFGVDASIVRQYFQKIKKEYELIENKRILVVNFSEGKRSDIQDVIASVGFKIPAVFKKYNQVKSKLDTNPFDLLLIENEFGDFPEKSIEKLIQDHSKALKTICFTSDSLTNYKELKNKAIIIQMKQRLGDSLIEAAKL